MTLRSFSLPKPQWIRHPILHPVLQHEQAPNAIRANVQIAVPTSRADVMWWRWLVLNVMFTFSGLLFLCNFQRWLMKTDTLVIYTSKSRRGIDHASEHVVVMEYWLYFIFFIGLLVYFNVVAKRSPNLMESGSIRGWDLHDRQTIDKNIRTITFLIGSIYTVSDLTDPMNRKLLDFRLISFQIIHLCNTIVSYYFLVFRTKFSFWATCILLYDQTRLPLAKKLVNSL